jgi:hypothetical protein
MKMDQNGHDLAWPQLPWALALFALGNLAGFELWLKAEQKIIDITEQFEYTHFENPPMMDRSCLLLLLF